MTLDADVERMLRDAMHRSRRTFKETLNAALRTGLGGASARAKPVRFVVKARAMGLRTGVDPTGFNRLADEFDVDAVVMKTQRGKRR